MNNLDLREEFAQLLEETGHYVLHQRTSRKIRCTCWNEKYQESDSSCPKCLGLGWVSRIERHLVRRDNASQVISLPNLIQQLSVGKLASDAMVFYFKHDAVPKAGDMIYEVGWKKNKPTHLISSFQISHVEGLRGDRGRVEYNQVVAKEINIDTTIKRVTIRKIGPMSNYEFIR